MPDVSAVLEACPVCGARVARRRGHPVNSYAFVCGTTRQALERGVHVADDRDLAKYRQRLHAANETDDML